MVKKIITVVLILAILGGAFYASYTLSTKYWDVIAPYIDGAELPAATQTQAVPVIATPTEAVTAETTTQALIAPVPLTVTTVDMPEDYASIPLMFISMQRRCCSCSIKRHLRNQLQSPVCSMTCAR